MIQFLLICIILTILYLIKCAKIYMLEERFYVMLFVYIFETIRLITCLSALCRADIAPKDAKCLLPETIASCRRHISPKNLLFHQHQLVYLFVVHGRFFGTYFSNSIQELLPNSPFFNMYFFIPLIRLKLMGGNPNQLRTNRMINKFHNIRIQIAYIA